jgi:small subunit ribosomal protein S10
MTIQFLLKSFTVQSIAQSEALLKSIFKNYSIKRFPTKVQKFTVQSSPHVHKKSREQFEMRTHKIQFTVSGLPKENIIQSIQTFKLHGVQLQLRVLDQTPLY